METFNSITKPALAPPGWLFPVVWTILYILMGIASYLACSVMAADSQSNPSVLSDIKTTRKSGNDFDLAAVFEILIINTPNTVRSAEKPVK